MKQINRKEAIKLGLRYFNAGKVCKKCGTDSKRYTINHGCVWCLTHTSRTLDFDLFYKNSFVLLPNGARNYAKELNNLSVLKAEGELECYVHGVHSEYEPYTIESKLLSIPLVIPICTKCVNMEGAEETRQRNLPYKTYKYLIRRLNGAIQRSKRYGFAYDLTLEILEKQLEKQNNRCVFTGVEFSEEVKPSIDRIDSSKGYTADNIQFITHYCNTLKQKLSNDEFVKKCENMVNTFKQIVDYYNKNNK